MMKRRPPLISRHLPGDMAQRASVVRLAARKAVNHGLQFFDLKTGMSLSKPDCIILDVTYRCVCQCQYCSIWKHRDNREELSSRQWQGILDSLEEWLGRFSVTFSGGDPFVRGDTVDIIEYACAKGLLVYLNLTGLLIDPSTTDRLLRAEVERLNVSLDAMDAGVVETLRGRKGVLEKTLSSLERFIRRRRELSSHTRLALTVTLTDKNLHEVPAIADYVARIGLDGMQISALYEDPVPPHDIAWYRTSPLWVKNLKLLEDVMDELIERKSRGERILNSVEQLRLMKDYYRDPRTLCRKPCLTPVRAFGINPYGDANICYLFDEPLGNLLEQSPAQIWNGSSARRKRAMLSRCNRTCRLINATYWKGIDERFRELSDAWRNPGR